MGMRSLGITTGYRSPEIRFTWSSPMWQADGSEDTLDDAEYEDHYRESLLLIEEKLGILDHPVSFEDGQRWCSMGGIALDDFQVFALAWGREGASEIRRKRAKFVREKEGLDS